MLVSLCEVRMVLGNAVPLPELKSPPALRVRPASARRLLCPCDGLEAWAQTPLIHTHGIIFLTPTVISTLSSSRVVPHNTLHTVTDASRGRPIAEARAPCTLYNTYI